MSEIHLKGMGVHTSGEMPAIGSGAPNFELVTSDLSVVSLSNYAGKKVILNIFPSIDTQVCAASAEKFNESASELNNTVVLCVSMDLPFAHKRFCDSMSLQDIIPLSDFRNRSFGRSYGLTQVDGPLAGLLARAVIVLNENHEVAYAQLVDEIGDEPDYESALNAVK